MTLKFRLWLMLPRWAQNIWRSPIHEHRVRWLRRFLLRLALGPRTYDYMKRILAVDPRTPRARQIDIVIRKDGMERRIEADWVRSLARIIHPVRLNQFPLEVPDSQAETYVGFTPAQPQLRSNRSDNGT